MTCCAFRPLICLPNTETLNAFLENQLPESSVS